MSYVTVDRRGGDRRAVAVAVETRSSLRPLARLELDKKS